MAVNVCKVCEQSYVTMQPDVGICRLCEIREQPWRNKIARELHALGASAFIIEAVRRGYAIGGMSDLTIPEYDPPCD